MDKLKNMHTMQVEKLHNFNLNIMLTTLVDRPFLKVVKQLFSSFFRRPIHLYTSLFSNVINMLAITFTLTYWCDNTYNFLLAASGLDASFKDFFSYLHLQEREPVNLIQSQATLSLIVSIVCGQSGSKFTMPGIILSKTVTAVS